MQLFNGCERRRDQCHQLSFYVEIGVNYFRTVSYDKATAFMFHNGVAPEVIARVTSLNSPRRKTKWEMHVDEAGLREALGARPLLKNIGAGRDQESSASR